MGSQHIIPDTPSGGDSADRAPPHAGHEKEGLEEDALLQLWLLLH